VVVAVASEHAENLTSDPAPTLGRAISAVADTAIDQARDLAVAHLDRWADQLHARCATTSSHVTETPPDLPPLLIGAIAGLTVAWAMRGRGAGS
jgi:hypothetical protein